MIKRILVPLDFSASARMALSRAEELVRRTSAELLVLHVGEGPARGAANGSGAVAPSELSAPGASVESVLAGIVGQLQTRGVRARASHVLGTPHEKILEAISSEKVDLVVMGTRGRRGLARLVLGSVAERVSHASLAPVIVCRADHEGKASAHAALQLGASHAPSMQSILVPTDFEPTGEAAVRAAFALAEQTGAKVHLLHAYPPVVSPGVGGLGSIDFEALHRRARERLTGAARPFADAPSLGKCLAVMGDPLITIMETAAQLDVGLIVVGTHGRTGIKKALLGSVAEQIVREAPCPVLVAKSSSTAPSALDVRPR
jgi:nucleotide-binding universal stress UspA family protein